MGLFKTVFSALFGIKKTINDSFFGEMEVDHVKVNGKKVNYFSCEKNFLPGQDTVNITVYSNGAEPSERQREACRKIINNYPEISDKINRKIMSEYTEAAEKLKVTDINKDFALQGIYIHEDEGTAVSWDLEYINLGDNVYADINFVGDEIDFIDIDSF